jgi:hypothetical protein
MITRRTNYQRKKPFPKKPPRLMSDKYLRDELDAIVREILPLMESCCFTCSSTHGLQVGHLFERRHTHTRWDTTVDGNNHLQCAPCNKKHESHKTIYEDKFVDRFGPKAFDDLQFRVRNKQKLVYADLLDLLEQKQEQLNRLQGKAA